MCFMLAVIDHHIIEILPKVMGYLCLEPDTKMNMFIQRMTNSRFQLQAA